MASRIPSLYFLQVTAFVLVCGVSFVPCFSARASEITPESVVMLTNKAREAQGFKPLSINDHLTQAAQAKAEDMSLYGYFAHTSPNGITPWHWISQSGYNYSYAGENLAIHFTSVEDQERAWMDSVKHRENILNPKYKDIGVAVVTVFDKGEPMILTVQMFGVHAGSVAGVESSGASTALSEGVKMESKDESEVVGNGLKEGQELAVVQNQKEEKKGDAIFSERTYLSSLWVIQWMIFVAELMLLVFGFHDIGRSFVLSYRCITK